MMTIIEALAEHSEWHGDASPTTGATGNYSIDLQIADAFRMMIYLGDHTRRLRWIEREVSDPCDQHIGCPCRGALILWWIAIFEDRTMRKAA
ncbi:hypothetical protein NKJ93_02170 [Mesorhizobium sp. M0028]|uniref:hypothetical protein n=1 Tax=Mesorhizobium sp. M0028 TaxID=2956849 RepID=UPI003336594E